MLNEGRICGAVMSTSAIATRNSPSVGCRVDGELVFPVLGEYGEEGLQEDPSISCTIVYVRNLCKMRRRKADPTRLHQLHCEKRTLSIIRMLAWSLKLQSLRFISPSTISHGPTMFIPVRAEDPGPPLVHTPIGSFSGSPREGKNQKKMSEPGTYPVYCFPQLDRKRTYGIIAIWAELWLPYGRRQPMPWLLRKGRSRCC